MIAEAKRRLNTRPDIYFNKIYGLDEAGGTSVLYLSELPFPELGFKSITKRSLPSYTWQALRLVPGIFLTMGGTLAFISWLTHRKDRLLKDEEARNAAQNRQKEIKP